MVTANKVHWNFESKELEQTWIHTSNPDLTIASTSTSLVNIVAIELNDRPNMIAKEMPVINPVWWNHMTCYWSAWSPEKKQYEIKRNLLQSTAKY